MIAAGGRVGFSRAMVLHARKETTRVPSGQGLLLANVARRIGAANVSRRGEGVREGAPAPLHESRSGHVAVPLADGRVLVCAGRHDTSDAMVGSCERGPSCRDPPGRAATALGPGYAIIAGCSSEAISLGSRWTPRAPLTRARWSHHAVRLPAITRPAQPPPSSRRAAAPPSPSRARSRRGPPRAARRSPCRHPSPRTAPSPSGSRGRRRSAADPWR